MFGRILRFLRYLVTVPDNEPRRARKTLYPKCRVGAFPATFSVKNSRCPFEVTLERPRRARFSRSARRHGCRVLSIFQNLRFRFFTAGFSPDRQPEGYSVPVDFRCFQRVFSALYRAEYSGSTLGLGFLLFRFCLRIGYPFAHPRGVRNRRRPIAAFLHAALWHWVP